MLLDKEIAYNKTWKKYNHRILSVVPNNDTEHCSNNSRMNHETLQVILILLVSCFLPNLLRSKSTFLQNNKKNEFWSWWLKQTLLYSKGAGIRWTNQMV